MTEIITVESREVQPKNLLGEDLVERFVRFAGVSEKSAATYKVALRQLQKFFRRKLFSKQSG